MEKFIFRVFDTKSKKMINSLQSLIFAHHGLVVEYNTMMNAGMLVYGGIVSQYTGKTDKNHKKIFTRDLIEVEWRRITPGAGTWKKIECIENMEDLFKIMHSPQFFACEVKGNMDEHPELLMPKEKPFNNIGK